MSDFTKELIGAVVERGMREAEDFHSQRNVERYAAIKGIVRRHAMGERGATDEEKMDEFLERFRGKSERISRTSLIKLRKEYDELPGFLGAVFGSFFRSHSDKSETMIWSFRDDSDEKVTPEEKAKRIIGFMCDKSYWETQGTCEFLWKKYDHNELFEKLPPRPIEGKLEEREAANSSISPSQRG